MTPSRQFEDVALPMQYDEAADRARGEHKMLQGRIAEHEARARASFAGTPTQTHEQLPLWYYHGTNRGGLGVIRPSADTGHVVHRNETSPEHAYATRDLGTARWYADAAANHNGGSRHVYAVVPTGETEADPRSHNGISRGNFDGDIRSRSPFKVLGRIKAGAKS